MGKHIKLNVGILSVLILFSLPYMTVSMGCLSCEESDAQCNVTHCYTQKCEQTDTCEGTCLLTVSLKPNQQDTAFTMCMNETNIASVYGEEDLGPTCIQSREPNYIAEENFSTVSCTCQSDNCNSNIVLMKIEPPTDAKEKDADITATLASGIAVGVVLVVAIILLFRLIVVRRRKLSDEKEKQAMAGAGQSRFSADSSSLLESAWDEMGKHSCSTYKYSNSVSSHYSRGSKGNALNQNDQHLPIEKSKIIGRGRFAEVWKAKLQQDNQTSKVISVKVFRLPNYGAWRQEKEILSERWMKHENIIEYYASEQHSSRGRLQYWLITAYYSKGNLQEFLRNNSLNWNEFCDMSASIARGLAYLHEEHDLDGHEKFPVAHRDVKSCNILVKDDGVSCVLADFGLSLKLDPSLSRDELANAGQVGTSRYMAPELLEKLVNLADIEMFKRVDMYAFSLVMWELATRCDVIDGMLRPYQPPFGDRITDHPSKEQILLLVCRSKLRPEIRPEWRAHTGLAKYIDTMTECWDSEPEARLTASCVHERILGIRNEECIAEVPLSPKEVEALQKEVIGENEANEMTELISTVV
ncbi:TGF-beta receptor type-2-like isoform X2 [Styela clava]|uniref:TGF-beta receptor type-2-like isoform X2 n=1 Tax=Styela clava TaxID=7725 RepID=UPI001939CEDA|nr:TGF-beta receptor type-2-like isoform X2 [Styela clava]